MRSIGVVAIALALLASPAMGASKGASSTTPATFTSANSGATTKAKLKKKTKPGVEYPRFSGGASFSYRNNYAEQRSPQIASNRLAAFAGVDFDKQWSLNAASALEYDTKGTTVVHRDNQASHRMADSSLDLTFSFPLEFTRPEIVIGNEFPTSQESQLEGVQSVTYFGTVVPIRLFKGFYTVRNEIFYNHIFNKYEFSPSAGTRTIDDSFSYDLINEFRLTSFWFAGFGLGVRQAKLRDAGWTFEASNSVFTRVTWSYYTFRVSYLNADYRSVASREENLWYIDKNRQTLTLKATVAF